MSSGSGSRGRPPGRARGTAGGGRPGNGDRVRGRVVRGEQAVVGVVGEEIAARAHQLEANEADGKPADEEEEGDGERVENGDALVVGRG